MKEYIEQNKERFFEELFRILRIPSISAKEEHKADSGSAEGGEGSGESGEAQE